MTSQSLISHIRELRFRVLMSAISVLLSGIAVFFLYDPILAAIQAPLAQIQGLSGESTLYVQTLYEAFLTKFKFSFVGGLVLSFPLIVFQVLRFVFPALTRFEKLKLGIILLFSLGFAFLAIYLVYFKILPYSLSFVVSDAFMPKSVGVLLNFNQNIFYVFNFLLYSILAFQFPLVLLFLLKIDVVSRAFLWRSSRIVVVLVFVLSALVTPPDIFSQVTLALPLMGLFFLTLLIAKLFKWGNG